MKYVVCTYLFGYRGIFVQFYFDSFELMWSGRKNHVGKKVPTWYNDFAFHVCNHVSICRMPTWVRKTAICPQIQQEKFLAIKSELLGLSSSWNIWNFLFSMRLSNGEYLKDFKFFDLTWIWWIWQEWPTV